jgi:acyl-coenzyme A thioesterase PaaI-like protein
MVNRGKNVGYLECDVTDQDLRLIAKVTSTCVVLRGEQAKAR